MPDPNNETLLTQKRLSELGSLTDEAFNKYCTDIQQHCPAIQNPQDTRNKTITNLLCDFIKTSNWRSNLITQTRFLTILDIIISELPFVITSQLIRELTQETASELKNLPSALNNIILRNPNYLTASFLKTIGPTLAQKLIAIIYQSANITAPIPNKKTINSAQERLQKIEELIAEIIQSNPIALDTISMPTLKRTPTSRLSLNESDRSSHVKKSVKSRRHSDDSEIIHLSDQQAVEKQKWATPQAYLTKAFNSFASYGYSERAIYAVTPQAPIFETERLQLQSINIKLKKQLVEANTFIDASFNRLVEQEQVETQNVLAIAEVATIEAAKKAIILKKQGENILSTLSAKRNMLIATLSDSFHQQTIATLISELETIKQKLMTLTNEVEKTESVGLEQATAFATSYMRYRGHFIDYSKTNADAEQDAFEQLQLSHLALSNTIAPIKQALHDNIINLNEAIAQLEQAKDPLKHPAVKLCDSLLPIYEEKVKSFNLIGVILTTSLELTTLSDRIKNLVNIEESDLKLTEEFNATSDVEEKVNQAKTFLQQHSQHLSNEQQVQYKTAINQLEKGYQDYLATLITAKAHYKAEVQQFKLHCHNTLEDINEKKCSIEEKIEAAKLYDDQSKQKTLAASTSFELQRLSNEANIRTADTLKNLQKLQVQVTSIQKLATEQSLNVANKKQAFEQQLAAVKSFEEQCLAEEQAQALRLEAEKRAQQEAAAREKRERERPLKQPLLDEIAKLTEKFKYIIAFNRSISAPSSNANNVNIQNIAAKSICDILQNKDIEKLTATYVNLLVTIDSQLILFAKKIEELKSKRKEFEDKICNIQVYAGKNATYDLTPIDNQIKNIGAIIDSLRNTKSSVVRNHNVAQEIEQQKFNLVNTVSTLAASLERLPPVDEDSSIEVLTTRRDFLSNKNNDLEELAGNIQFSNIIRPASPSKTSSSHAPFAISADNEKGNVFNNLNSLKESITNEYETTAKMAQVTIVEIQAGIKKLEKAQLDARRSKLILDLTSLMISRASDTVEKLKDPEATLPKVDDVKRFKESFFHTRKTIIDTDYLKDDAKQTHLVALKTIRNELSGKNPKEEVQNLDKDWITNQEKSKNELDAIKQQLLKLQDDENLTAQTLDTEEKKIGRNQTIYEEKKNQYRTNRKQTILAAKNKFSSADKALKGLTEEVEGAIEKESSKWFWTKTKKVAPFVAPVIAGAGTGAGIGFWIGTAIFPGLGSIAGAAAGGFFGAAVTATAEAIFGMSAFVGTRLIFRNDREIAAANNKALEQTLINLTANENVPTAGAKSDGAHTVPEDDSPNRGWGEVHDKVSPGGVRGTLSGTIPQVGETPSTDENRSLYNTIN